MNESQFKISMLVKLGLADPTGYADIRPVPEEKFAGTILLEDDNGSVLSTYLECMVCLGCEKECPIAVRIVYKVMRGGTVVFTPTAGDWTYACDMPDESIFDVDGE